MTNQLDVATLIASLRGDVSKLPSDLSKGEAILKQSVGKLGRAAQDQGAGVGSSLGKGIQQGLGSLLGGGMGAILGGGIVAGIGMLGKAALEQAGQMAELGRASDRIAVAFVDQWGSQAPAAMDKLRSASMGAINDMDLQLAANRARMLKVTNDADELAALLQVAQARGRALGISSSQAFDNIVTGIGRVSPLILDNLGILTGGEAAFSAYAASIGKAGQELTDIEKRQALVNLVVGEAQTLTADSTTKHEALTSAKQNLRATIGGLIDDFIDETGVVEALTDSLNRQAEAIQEHEARQAQVADSALTFSRAMEALAESGQYVANELGPLAIGAQELARQYADGEITLYDYRIGMQALGADLAQLSGVTYPELIQMGNNWANQQRITALATDQEALAASRMAERMAEAESRGEQLNETIHKMAGYAVSLSGAEKHAALEGKELAATMARMEVSAGRLKGAIGGVTEEMRRMAWASMAAQASEGPYQGTDTSGGYEVYESSWELNQARAPERAAALAADQQSYVDRLDAQAGYASDSEALAKQQFDRLRGIVESALSPTEVTAADIAATAAGTYVDKWDEAMRRIRMPESGLSADQIAEQERLFYSGQQLDQVNWGAVVGDVQRKLEEEAGRAAMVEEAMRQVQMAGIGASQSQVAEALGVKDYAAVGREQGDSLAGGVAATGLAAKFTDQFVEEYQKEQQRWVDLGALSVAWMAQGIETGVTPAVTELLVNLLAPKLYETLTGGARP